MRLKRKAQIWYTDFMIGLLIFVIVIFIYYEYAHNINQNPGEITSDLVMDAKAVSSSLITQGSPIDWNETDVKMIGLTDGRQRIVQSKLDNFASMPYQQTKTKLRTSYDFYVFFEAMNGSRILVNGAEGIGLDNNETDNAVTLTRLVIYDSELTSMVVKVWD